MPDNRSTDEFSLDDLAAEGTQEPQQEVQAPQEEQAKPGKYDGKTQAELVHMLSQQEQFIGKQSNDVGELRSLVDDFIRAGTASPAPSNKQEESSVDIFGDPEGTINRAIENHPAVRAARETADTMARQTVQAKLQQAHPDAATVITNPRFMEWVNGSPVRRQLFKQGQEYNFDAASELISTFKSMTSLTTEAANIEASANVAAVNNAASGNVRGGSSGRNTAPTLSRAKIIKLMNEDPAMYQAKLPEIERAYAEKRVR